MHKLFFRDKTKIVWLNETGGSDCCLFFTLDFLLNNAGEVVSPHTFCGFQFSAEKGGERLGHVTAKLNCLVFWLNAIGPHCPFRVLTRNPNEYSAAKKGKPLSRHIQEKHRVCLRVTSRNLGGKAEQNAAVAYQIIRYWSVSCGGKKKKLQNISNQNIFIALHLQVKCCIVGLFMKNVMT